MSILVCIIMSVDAKIAENLEQYERISTAERFVDKTWYLIDVYGVRPTWEM